jgi:hypothetical protein
MTASSPFRPHDAAHATNPFLGAVSAVPTPFEREPRRATVPADAPEGSYTYAMIPALPAVDPSEVESAAEAIEIEVRWGDQVLHVAHLAPPRAFWVGEDQRPGAACDVLLPESQLGASRVPLALVDERGVWAVLPAGAEARLTEAQRAAVEPCAELAGAHRVLLARGAGVTSRVGDFTFRVASVQAARKVAGTASLDRHAAAATLGSALVHGAFLAALALMMPPLGATDEGAIDDEQQYRLMQAIQALADAEKERRDEPSDDASSASREEGGSGKRAEAEEGKMGSEVSTAQNRRFALKGDAKNRDLMLPREVALQEARDFGMIGLLRDLGGADPNAPVAPWGDEMVGNEAVSARGTMWGETIGDAAGAGGLGLSGIGEGGGGKWLGVGLGDIGTVGHGAGTCTTPGCQGFGRGGGPLGPGHATRAGRMRPAGDTTTSGRLPPEVIQRVVRQNFGRFRACYEAALRTNPNLAGRVAVRFVIGRDGSVGSAANGGSDLPDGGVVSCVVRAFHGLSFPAPESGIVTVTYPIAFSPG